MTHIDVFGEENIVKNCDIHDNASIDLPSWNKNQSGTIYDAPVLIRLAGDIGANNFYGNKIRNNLIYRTDGSTRIAVKTAVPLTYYNLAGLNGLPNCAGNISGDPLFSDPANGDFTLESSDSPVHGWFDENVPVVPFVEEDLLDGICPI